MNEHEFKGTFAAHLSDFISLKKSIGYKYITEAESLMSFSKFTAEHFPTATELTKEIVLEWCAKRTWESSETQCSRASILRQFSIYLDRIGEKSFILPKGFYPSGPQYIPHIYTEDELRRFFAATDKCHEVSECQQRHLVMPVFFRMIYSCALRCSEARLLKVSDVDLETGIVRIMYAKNDNCRIVAMSRKMNDRCRIYAEKVHNSSCGDDWFFPGMNGKPITAGNAYHNFRRFLWQAGISHGGRGKEPRIHDFRHTAACVCLKRWVSEGKNLNAYLPVLKAHMGHESYYDTAYYLRLTADVYEDIEDKISLC